MYMYYGHRKIDGSGGLIQLQVPDNMKVNGKYLNNIVDGYRQLTVAGRGLLENKIDTVDVLGRSGLYVKSSKHPERVMEVKYMLTAKNSEELREKFNILNTKLSGKLEISFDDEPNYVYRNVYMTGVDIIEESSLNIISKFELTATDPYKYGEMEEGERVRLLRADFVDVYSVRIDFDKVAIDPVVTVFSGNQVYGWSYGGHFQEGSHTTLTFDGTNSRASSGNNGGRVTTVSYDNLPRTVVAINGTSGNVRNSDNVICGTVTFRYRDRAI